MYSTQGHADLGNNGLFLPHSFSGVTTDNARDFIYSFQLWHKFHDLQNDKAKAAFELLLDGHAKIWLKSLDPNKITNLNQLIDLFLQRFTCHERIWKESADLFKYKQSRSQNTQDFIAEILVKAKHLCLNDKTIFDIVLNGLIPETRSHVIQAEVKNLTELNEQALCFERARDPDEIEKSNLCWKMLEDCQNQLKNISSSVLNEGVSDVVPSFETMQGFSLEIDSEVNTFKNGWQNDYRNSESNIREPYQGTFNTNVLRQDQMPGPNVRATRRHKSKRQDYFPVSKVNSKSFAHNFNGTKPYNSTKYFKGPNFQINAGYSRCNRCARFHGAHFCPAIGAFCTNCKKRNHFERACRSGRMINQNAPKFLSQVNGDQKHRHQIQKEHRQSMASQRSYGTSTQAGSQNLNQNTGTNSPVTKLVMNNVGDISVFVFHKHSYAQIASTEEVSAISAKFLKALPSHTRFDTNVKQNLISASGERLNVVGQVNLPINLNGLKVNFKFLVISNLKHNIVLANDFLTFSNAVVNYANHTVSFYDELVTLNLISRGDQIQDYVLRLPARVKVAARSVLLSPITIPHRFINKDAVIQPLLASPKQEYLIASILVHPITKSSVVHILNPTFSEIEIPENTPIASIAEAESTSIPTTTTTSSEQSVNTTPLDPAAREAMLKDLGIQIDEQHLTKEQVEQLSILICRNRTVFAKNLSEIPGTDLISHTIPTFGIPKRQRAFRHSPDARAEISRQVKQMLQDGIIEESFSLWASPVLLVSKKGGDKRFVCDYRSLNAQTLPLNFPLPTLHSVLDTLSENHPSWFSALDMKSGYYQIKLDPSTKECTTFITHEGTYCFNRLPFGCRNASQTYQHFMQSVFKGQLYRFCLVYIDDILVFSNSFQDHLEHLQVVFDRLLEAKLRLHPGKSYFCRRQVTFLGHKLSSQGLSVDESKIEKIKFFPKPQNVTQLKQYLGL
jgi:hypothetical protein